MKQTHIGRIRILGLLGRGGMGQVYEGFDEKLERKVAVKRIDDTHRFDSETRHRLEQEAKLLSRLDHPNICRIYDVVEDGEHDYLVLELISGSNLREVMQRNPDRQKKLHLAQQIARALAAAHSEGVVHRDLKPDNVMVTHDGAVKVFDFGIAHSIRGDVLEQVTVVGAVPLPERTPGPEVRAAIGTPGFMSPEQARGEPVTPASDLYSMGLLLQELFTGESATEAGLEPRELLTAVAEGRSRPVSRLDRPLTDLIERLKSANPADRLTATDLVRDLQTIAEQPQRRLKRALIAATVLIALTGVAKYTLDLHRERQRAVQARLDSEELVAFLLEDLGHSLAPLGRLSLLEKVSGQALDYFDNLPKPLSHEASLIRGQALRMAAEVDRDLGRIDSAIEAAAQALDIHRHLTDVDGDRLPWLNAVAEDQLVLGDLYSISDDYDRASKLLESAKTTAVRLVATDPKATRYRETLAEASYGLGLNILWTDPEAAIGHFNDAIEAYRSLSADNPDDPSYRYRLAVLHGQGLGQAYSLIGREARAFDAVTLAHQEYEAVVENDPSNTHWLFAFAWEKRRLGDLLADRGRLDEAWNRYAESLAISDRLLELEPSNTGWQEGRAVDLAGMGDLRLEQHRDDEALGLFEQSAQIYRALSDVQPGLSTYRTNLADVLHSQGRALSALGERRAAELTWQRALGRVPDCSGLEDDPDRACLSLRAMLLIRLGRIDDARPLVEELTAMGDGDIVRGKNLDQMLRAAVAADR